MSWWQLMKSELRAVMSNSAVLLIIIGGCLFYSFLYPQPYLEQSPREQKIVVVNLDNTPFSRHLERMVDATPEVKIVQHVTNIDEAKQLFYHGDVSGLMIIPHDFYRDMMRNQSPVISYAGDASYFLIYSAIVQGSASAIGTLNASVSVSRLLAKGNSVLAQTKKNHAEIQLNARPVFNPSVGYINYVVPAVFIIILHQTLLISVGILGGTQHEQTKKGIQGYWLTEPVWKVISVRLLIFICIYFPMMMYYMGLCFHFYGISRLASVSNLFVFSLAFLTATASLGMVLGALVPRRELVTFLVLLSSLPLVFSAGFIWPTEFLPQWINTLMQFIPSTASILGFVKLNQMGAQMSQILDNWLELWKLAGLYLLLAYWLMVRKQKSVIDI